MFIFVVIEVANGDYGDFVQQLSTAANRATTYQKSDDPGDDSSTPVITVNTLSCIDAPLLKKQATVDGKDVITVPSEWSKFWTLVGRCHVHYYRDWVCSFFFFWTINVQNIYSCIYIADSDTFEISIAYIVCDINWFAVR